MCHAEVVILGDNDPFLGVRDPDDRSVFEGGSAGVVRDVRRVMAQAR